MKSYLRLALTGLIMLAFIYPVASVLAQSNDFPTFNADGDTRGAGGTTNPSKNGRGER
jgi:hypothetical protein